MYTGSKHSEGDDEPSISAVFAYTLTRSPVTIIEQKAINIFVISKQASEIITLHTIVATKYDMVVILIEFVHGFLLFFSVSSLMKENE